MLLSDVCWSPVVCRSSCGDYLSDLLAVTLTGHAVVWSLTYPGLQADHSVKPELRHLQPDARAQRQNTEANMDRKVKNRKRSSPRKRNQTEGVSQSSPDKATPPHNADDPGEEIELPEDLGEN